MSKKIALIILLVGGCFALCGFLFDVPLVVLQMVDCISDLVGNCLNLFVSDRQEAAGLKVLNKLVDEGGNCESS
jgi:hypothetical protein